jgi:hypothetical protein
VYKCKIQFVETNSDCKKYIYCNALHLIGLILNFKFPLFAFYVNEFKSMVLVYFRLNIILPIAFIFLIFNLSIFISFS